MSYSSLNDAAATSPLLAAGDVKVWYGRNEVMRDLMMGVKFATTMGVKLDKNNLYATHVQLGGIQGRGTPDEIFMALQAENWSPEGEARDFIRGLGLSHTSMCVGDIIEQNGKVLVVDMLGFTELT